MKRSALLILPCLVLCVMFSAVPMALSAVAGLWDINFQENAFVGIANYIKAATDTKFLGAMFNGLIFGIIFTSMNYGVAVPFGLLVAELPKGVRRKVQTALFIPTLATGMVMAALWRMVFSPVHGPFVEIINVWRNRWTSIATVCFILAVGSSSREAMTISILAGSVGEDVREAARMDGAQRRKIRWQIVFPEIATLVFFLMIFSMIGATQIWETIQAVSFARPNMTAGTPVWEILDTGFTRIQYGLACAKTMIYLAAFGLIMLIVRLVKR
jgi:ABC-type sugar transport system permease subunit